MIDIDNISLFLGNEKKPLQISNLNFKNGLWAIVGRNGAGKSTFLNALSGVNTNFNGVIKFNNKILNDFSAQELAKQIAVVFSKTELFGNHTALDILLLGRIPHQGILTKVSKNDMDIVNKIAEQIGINELLKKPFLVLSDGEKQMVMIGRALVQDTPILLLDEPTAFLDVVNRKKIVSLLSSIVKQQNKLILFSTHNLDLVEQFCDGLLIIQNNELKQIVGKENFKSQMDKLFIDEV